MPGRYIKIESLERDELTPYRTLKRPVEHGSAGIFIAEGSKLVARLIESSLTMVSILASAKWRPLIDPLLDQRAESIPVYLGDEQLLNTIVGYSLHQAIMAVGKIPPPCSLDSLIRKRGNLLLAAADNVVSAENMGVIIRNCAAFNVDALIAGETCVDPYHRRSVRNSMGTIFHLPVCVAKNLETDLKWLKTNANISLYAAHPHIASRPLHEVDLTGNCCVVFGNEADGVRDSIIAEATPIMIPMKPGVDSLNVANAAAVILYEIQRQRLNNRGI